MQKSETYVGIREAAELLDKSPDTIRRWIKSGKIQASKQGNQYQILSAEIDKLRSKEHMQKTIQEHRQTDGNVEMEIVKLLRERISELEADKGFLLEQIREKDKLISELTIRALPKPKTPLGERLKRIFRKH